MSDQPTALRLASVLQNMGHKDVRLEAAGYELRRLHDVLGKSQALNRIREARIKELEAQRDELLEALKSAQFQIDNHCDMGVDAWIACRKKVHAAISKCEGEKE